MADDDDNQSGEDASGEKQGKDGGQDSGDSGDKGGGRDSGGDEGKDKDGGKTKQDDKKEDEKKPTSIWPWVIAGAVVVVFVAVILIIVLVPHEHVKTDDAYVTAHYAVVSPKVQGQIASVPVNDNQTVRAGQLLATIDPRDLQATLAEAEAARQSDRARVGQADAQVARQPSLIRQAAAQVTSARARLDLAMADQRRYTNLAATGAGTFQQHQQADATLREAQATLAQAEAELSSQNHQLDGLRADRAAAAAQVGRDDAQVAAARLMLSYTRIVAPIAGTIGQRAVQIGNQVQPGAPLMAVVPLDSIYVMANYRELELRHMRPGQHAVIHIDAYDIDLAGYVQSLPPASGASFSPIPPNNATGNFTKIVQRLPVKIIVAPHQPLARLLRVGMSAVVTVDTNLDDVVGDQRCDGAVRESDRQGDPNRDADRRTDRDDQHDCARQAPAS